MQAVWLENNQISMRDVAQPQKTDEALIKIRKAGICSTDLDGCAVDARMAGLWCGRSAG